MRKLAGTFIGGMLVLSVSQDMKLLMKPGVWETWVATAGQGLPNKLLSVDEVGASWKTRG